MLYYTFSFQLFHPATIFAHLLDDSEDSGETVPNPTFIYRVQKLGLDSIAIKDVREIGIPFQWAQTLGGLVFPKFEAVDERTDLTLKVDEAVSQSKVSSWFNVFGLFERFFKFHVKFQKIPCNKISS